MSGTAVAGARGTGDRGRSYSPPYPAQLPRSSRLDDVGRVGRETGRLRVVAERPVAVLDRRADPSVSARAMKSSASGVLRMSPSRIGPSVWVAERPMFS